ncbi:DUF1289 domain-containing protein [Variovorax saccharolyticus]|uniref:DUF1289 domain-containing protein n=1 Tax=Variovorax saccharolyticus TaxID=3053516 RepID=UPI0025756A3B|nr:DUF1289 domain-containing protein [Variovorax sp. J22R187]MDM0022523.1 DUF1289 domain-containing protein [Variovorax sp. J22R187]
MSENVLVADPCVNICRVDPDGKFCQGCKRTALEIGSWPRMTEQQRADVAALIRQRTDPAVTRAMQPTP